MDNNTIEQLRDDYGDELIDGLTDLVEQKATQVANQQSFVTKKAMLSDRLSRHSIDFEQVNNDPVFHDWLSKFDPNTGVQRQTELSQAFNSGDLTKVEEMFTTYVQGGGQQPAGNAPQSNHSMAAQFGNEQHSAPTMEQLRLAHGKAVRDALIAQEANNDPKPYRQKADEIWLQMSQAAR